LLLVWVIVKLFAFVTEIRNVTLVCPKIERSTGGGSGTVDGWFFASVVGAKTPNSNVTTNFPSLRHGQHPHSAVEIPKDSVRRGNLVLSNRAVPSLCRVSWLRTTVTTLDPSPQRSVYVNTLV